MRSYVKYVNANRCKYYTSIIYKKIILKMYYRKNGEWKKMTLLDRNVISLYFR